METNFIFRRESTIVDCKNNSITYGMMTKGMPEGINLACNQFKLMSRSIFFKEGNKSGAKMNEYLNKDDGKKGKNSPLQQYSQVGIH